MRLILITTSVYLSGCASWQLQGGSSVKDSTLSNLNPAPESMSPPAMVEGDNVTVDPVYMRAQADYHFTMGEAYSLEGKAQKAIDEFKLTLVYDPDSVTLRQRLAQEYVRIGLLSEAIEQAELAVEKDPKSADARMLLGSLYSSLKMYEQAIAHYQELLKHHPEQKDAVIFIGAILAEQKKFDESIGYFKKFAATAEPTEASRAWYYVARIRIEQGKVENHGEVESAFIKALSLKPDYPEAVIAYATFLREKKKNTESVRLLESYQLKSGPDKEVAKVLSRIYLEAENYAKAFQQLEVVENFERDNLNVKVQMALILIEQEKYEQAAIRLEDILVVAPELDKIRYYLGAVYEQTQNSAASIQQYLSVPPISVYYADAMIHAAHLYKQSGQFKKAIEVVTKAIKERDDIPQFYAYYASLLDDVKDYRTAVSMLSGAVEKFPSHTQLRFFLGSMQDRIGNSRATIEQMRKVLELDEEHVQAMNYLAYTYAELNENLDTAEGLAKKALSMQPGDGYILDTLGWVLFKGGRLEESIRYLEAAFKVKADESVIAEHLGDAYYRYQMVEKAKEMYRRAVEVETDEGKVRKIKDKIVSIDSQMQGRDKNNRQPASVPEPKDP